MCPVTLAALAAFPPPHSRRGYRRRHLPARFHCTRLLAADASSDGWAPKHRYAWSRSLRHHRFPRRTAAADISAAFFRDGFIVPAMRDAEPPKPPQLLVQPSQMRRRPSDPRSLHARHATAAFNPAAQQRPEKAAVHAAQRCELASRQACCRRAIQAAACLQTDHSPAYARGQRCPAAVLASFHAGTRTVSRMPRPNKAGKPASRAAALRLLSRRSTRVRVAGFPQASHSLSGYTPAARIPASASRTRAISSR